MLVKKSKLKKKEEELEAIKKLLKEVLNDRGFCYLDTSTMNKVVKATSTL